MLQLLLERLEAELTQLREVRPPGGGAGLRERIPGLIVELVLLGRELQGRDGFGEALQPQQDALSALDDSIGAILAKLPR